MPPKRRFSSLLVTDEYASQLDVDAQIAKELQDTYDSEDNYEIESNKFKERRQVRISFAMFYHLLTAYFVCRRANVGVMVLEMKLISLPEDPPNVNLNFVRRRAIC